MNGTEKLNKSYNVWENIEYWIIILFIVISYNSDWCWSWMLEEQLNNSVDAVSVVVVIVVSSSISTSSSSSCHASRRTVILQWTMIIVKNRLIYTYIHDIVQYEHVIMNSVAVYCYLQITNMGIKKMSR